MNASDALVVRTNSERRDDQVRVVLAVDLPPGVHIEPHEPSDPWLIPTVLEVDGLADVHITYPAPVVKDLGWNGVTLTVLEGTVVFVATGRACPTVGRLAGTLRFQPCVGGACLPARTVEWEAPAVGSSAYSVLGALAAA